MQIRPLAIPDAFEITPAQHGDDRGTFLEWFKAELFEQSTGHRMPLQQANCSVSQRGVVRGVHFADVPPGQAKYVTCFSGAVLDVVVDLRVGSPTFSHVDSVMLDDESRRAVFVGEGLGHAFMALSERATVGYLCSTPYNPAAEHGVNPAAEHGVNPADPALLMPWPHDVTPVLSPKDEAAPTLEQALDQGLLPDYEQCQQWYRVRDGAPQR